MENREKELPEGVQPSVLKALRDAFRAGSAYTLASHEDFKQTHPDENEYVSRYLSGYISGYLKKVEEFTILSGQKVPDAINIDDVKLNALRIGLIKEEFNELIKALMESDKTEVLDALIDLQYVLSGAVLCFGFKNIFDREFDNVDANNKTKVHTSRSEAIITQEYYAEKGINTTLENTVDEIYVVKNSLGKLLKPYNYKSVKLNLNS